MVVTWSGSLEPITAESTAARIPYTTQPPTFYLSTRYDSGQDLPPTTSGQVCNQQYANRGSSRPIKLNLFNWRFKF